MRKFLFTFFIFNYSFVGMADDRREKNLELFTNIAKVRSSSISTDYPQEFFFKRRIEYKNISELIQDIQKFEHELGDTKRKRSVYFETYKLIKDTLKRYRDAVSLSQKNFFEATGREPTEDELAAAIKRKFGIEYGVIQELFLAAPEYISQFTKHNKRFLIAYSKLADNLVSKYDDNGHLIHPSISTGDFIKYTSSLPNNSSCKIGRVQKTIKYNEDYLRIYLDNDIEYFEIAASSLKLKTPVEGDDETYELLFGETQGYRNQSSMEFNASGELKAIKIKKTGVGLAYKGSDWWVDLLGNPLNFDIKKQTIAKDVSYFCKVNARELEDYRAALAVHNNERSDEKLINLSGREMSSMKDSKENFGAFQEINP